MHSPDSPEAHGPGDPEDRANQDARLEAIKRFLRLPPFDEDLPPPRILPLVPGYPSAEELGLEGSEPATTSDAGAPATTERTTEKSNIEGNSQSDKS
jgi:hypothetical protein